jgi:hypothetical protein
VRRRTANRDPRKATRHPIRAELMQMGSRSHPSTASIRQNGVVECRSDITGT